MSETDIRIVKTIDGINESFLQCLGDFGFQNMTVKNITEKARVNRSTFYAHFKDKYDLRDKYVDRIINDFIANLDTQFIGKKQISNETCFIELKKCLESIRTKKREYLILWNSNLVDRNVFDEMISEGIHKLISEFSDTKSISKTKEPFFSLYASLFLGNMMVSVRWWFEKGQHIDVDIFTNLMIHHMSEGIFNTLKNE